jgi:hypothetical protein
VGAELFHAGGQKDMKVILAFRKFVRARARLKTHDFVNTLIFIA